MEGLDNRQTAAERKRIQRSLKGERGEKYKGVLRGMDLAFWPLLAHTRGNIPQARLRRDLLTMYYALMRRVDDVVDGDAPLPAGVGSATEYVLARIDAAGRGTAHDIADAMYQYCSSVAQRLGYSIADETRSILGSMLFDARRRDHYLQTRALQQFEWETLREHFYRMDTHGTIRGMLRIFDEDPEKAHLLDHIGTASRIKLNLQDLCMDIGAGFLNIPTEDMQRLGISGDELGKAAALGVSLDETLLRSGALPPRIAVWTQEQAELGLDLIAAQKQELQGQSFGAIGRGVLYVMYTRPTQKYLQSIAGAFV